MFEKGDIVLHPGYGAGLVVGVKALTMSGNERPYYHVDLMDGDRSLMIPVEEAEAVVRVNCGFEVAEVVFDPDDLLLKEMAPAAPPPAE